MSELEKSDIGVRNFLATEMAHRACPLITTLQRIETSAAPLHSMRQGRW
jgi:hypothetical protein